MGKRPNFLFFITDQHRADWLGCYGHPVVKTPHIDRIADQGVRFEDFHTAAPVCMPNRASLMTGRMPSVHGLRYNGCRLPLSARTFVDVLRAGGYDTAAIGKSHLQPFLDTPPIRKADGAERLIPEAWAPEPEGYAHEEPGRYEADGRYVFPTPYYGFDHVDMITSHGDRCGGHYAQWFRENAPDWEALWDDANELPHNYSCPQAYRTPVPEALYPTSWIADRAIDYLSDPARAEAPFFAFVSFPDPHHPFNPPGKYWDMYGPDQFEIPTPYSDCEGAIPQLAWLEEAMARGGGQLTKQTAFMSDDASIREMMALTAGMIACVDDAVGRVTRALREAELDEDTIIVFTSDHGDFLGDYNLMLKGVTPSRGLTRVPMIWADPEGPSGTATGALATTIDLSASILERAGLAPYNGIQGRSLLPAVAGGDHREEVLVEFNDNAVKFGLERPARIRSLVTKSWRYTLFAGEDFGELYDLEADPRETRNLWNDPGAAAVKAALSERLNHHLAQQMDESPLSDRLA